MAKKIIRLTITAEMEIDTCWYDKRTDDYIKKYEKLHYKEWFFDHIIDKKIVFKRKTEAKKKLTKKAIKKTMEWPEDDAA